MVTWIFEIRSAVAELDTANHLKIRTLVQGQGGFEFRPAGMLEYIEDLKRGPNAEIGPEDLFEIASNG